MLGNYSKFIAALIGGIMAFLVSKFALPVEWADPDGSFVTAIHTVITALFVYSFPENTTSA